MSDNITREPYRNAWYKQLSDAVKKHDEEIAEMTPHLVPEVEEGDNGKILIAGEDGAFDWGQPPEELPVITEGDEGKVLKVTEGLPSWEVDQDAEIPPHTSADAGKILSVNSQNNLVWSEADVAIAEALVRLSEANRNNIYRGANLLDTYTIEQLHEKISTGDFSNLYIGDYIPVTANYNIKQQFVGETFESGVTYYEKSGSYPNWVFTETEDVTPQVNKKYYYTKEFTASNEFMIAHFNYFSNVGYPTLLPNHVVLVPRARINPTNADGKWNIEKTVDGGYTSSYVHQVLLPQYFNVFNTFFNNHLLSWTEDLTTVADLAASSTALSTLVGTSKTVAQRTMSIRLMNECMIFGCPIASSSCRDNTMFEQLALFKLKKYNQLFTIDTGVGAIWTSSIAMQYGAAYLNVTGCVGIGVVTSNASIVPIIVFG